MYVSSHPLVNHKAILSKMTEKIETISQDDEGQYKTIGGIITRVQNILTKKGDQMCFADIEDLSDTLELVVFPNVFTESRALLEVDQIVLVRGKISDKDGEIKMLADSIKAIDDPNVGDMKSGIGNRKPKLKPKSQTHKFDSHVPSKNSSGNLGGQVKKTKLLKIRIPVAASPDVFEQLKEVFQKHPGDSRVSLVIPDREGTPREIKTDFTVESTDEFKGQLREVLKESIK